MAARHDAYFACLQITPGLRAVSTDACVPISRLAECIAETDGRHRSSYLACRCRCVGHVGDGNFHLVLLVDPNEPAEMRDAPRRSTSALVERALAMDGTCTGEHGVGMGKIGSMRRSWATT